MPCRSTNVPMGKRFSQAESSSAVMRVKTDMMPRRSPPSAPASEPADHPKGHPHAAIEAFVSQTRAVAQVLDQVVLLAQRRSHAHHAPAVDELLLDLVAPAGLDAHRRVARLLRSNARRRRRNLGQGFELGRLLCSEGQRDGKKRENKDLARHRAKFHFPASLSEPMRIRGSKEGRAMF